MRDRRRVYLFSGIKFPLGILKKTMWDRIFFNKVTRFEKLENASGNLARKKQ